MLEKENIYYLRNRNVKRMLWPVDHHQVGNDLKKERLSLTKEYTEKYNFDFENGKPMHGKYKWVPMRDDSPISDTRIIEDTQSCSQSDKDMKENNHKSIKRKSNPKKNEVPLNKKPNTRRKRSCQKKVQPMRKAKLL